MSGGRLVKNTGDGYLLIFDDPVKAARWSIGVQRSHREDPITTPLGPLDVKIGLHVGAPLPNPHDRDDFIGQEMDLAARLCDGASRGQVLISEPAAALIRAASLSDVRIHPHGFRELKGFGNVPVFELLGGTQRPTPPARRCGLTEQPPVAPRDIHRSRRTAGGDPLSTPARGRDSSQGRRRNGKDRTGHQGRVRSPRGR